MSAPIRTAVLGYGLACKSHCPLRLRGPGLELTAIVQRRGDEAAADYPGVKISAPSTRRSTPPTSTLSSSPLPTTRISTSPSAPSRPASTSSSTSHSPPHPSRPAHSSPPPTTLAKRLLPSAQLLLRLVTSPSAAFPRRRRSRSHRHHRIPLRPSPPHPAPQHLEGPPAAPPTACLTPVRISSTVRSPSSHTLGNHRQRPVRRRRNGNRRRLHHRPRTRRQPRRQPLPPLHLPCCQGWLTLLLASPSTAQPAATGLNTVSTEAAQSPSSTSSADPHPWLLEPESAGNPRPRPQPSRTGQPHPRPLSYNSRRLPPVLRQRPRRHPGHLASGNPRRRWLPRRPPPRTSPHQQRTPHDPRRHLRLNGISNLDCVVSAPLMRARPQNRTPRMK